jgi:hypothetical protein
LLVDDNRHPSHCRCMSCDPDHFNSAEGGNPL